LLQLRCRFAVQFPPQLGQQLVAQFDHMEPVVDQHGVRQVFPHRQGVGRRHVGRHRFDPCPRAVQPFPERIERLGPLLTARNAASI